MYAKCRQYITSARNQETVNLSPVSRGEGTDAKSLV